MGLKIFKGIIPTAGRVAHAAVRVQKFDECH